MDEATLALIREVENEKVETGDMENPLAIVVYEKRLPLSQDVPKSPSIQNKESTKTDNDEVSIDTIEQLFESDKEELREKKRWMHSDFVDDEKENPPHPPKKIN